MLSSPTTDRLPLATTEKPLGDTYTDMLGCSMSRSSIGLASAVAPSAVKQTNQLSSRQPRPARRPPHSRPEPGDPDGAEEEEEEEEEEEGGVAVAPERAALGQNEGRAGAARPRRL